MLKKILCVVLSAIIAFSVFSCCAYAFDGPAAHDSEIELNQKNEPLIEKNDESSSFFSPFSLIMSTIVLVINIPTVPYRLVMFPYHVYLLASGKMSFIEFLFLEDGIWAKREENL